MNSKIIRQAALFAVCMLIAAGIVYLYLSSGDATTDAASAKEYVAKNHIYDTSAQNAVTAVYLNYRLFDTIFESLVLLISVLAVISLSWSSEKAEKEKRNE